MQPADLPWRSRALLAVYPWRVVPLSAPTVLRVALPAARVALVTTAGLVPPGQAPFDLDHPGGDTSYRVIDATVPSQALAVHHRSHAVDRVSLLQDRNVAYPIDVLRSLVEAGVVGSVAPRHLSFMGSITAPGRLQRESAPAAARLLADDQVDIALLVPV